MIAPADDDRPLPGLRRPGGQGDAGAVQRVGGPARVRPAVGGPGPPLAAGRATSTCCTCTSRPCRACRCWPAGWRPGPIVATVHTAMPRSRVLLATPAGDCAARWRRSTAGSRSPRRRARRWSSTSAATRCSSRTAWRPTRATGTRLPLDGWPATGGAIGFLGRMDEPRKGLAVLLKAFEILAAAAARPAAAHRRPRRRRRRSAQAARPAARPGALPRRGRPRRRRSGSCTPSTCSARRTPAASPSASSPPRRWRPARRSWPATSRRSAGAARRHRGRAVRQRGRRRPRARGGGAARRPGPARRSCPVAALDAVRGLRLVGRGPGRAQRLRDRGARPHRRWESRRDAGRTSSSSSSSWSSWACTCHGGPAGWTGCTTGSDAARTALDLALVRRSSSAYELASSGLLDPATSLLLADAVRRAKDGDPDGAARTSPKAT